MSGDKKLIYLLVAIIIIFATILLIKIKTTPQYDPEVYLHIYSEYENIFSQEVDSQIIAENHIQNKIENDVIKNENNIYTAATGTTTSNIENSNVIGKIIIPKIDIKYPIIKKTTTEYLKIAPTKYCGPEINEIRKFSYIRP